MNKKSKYITLGIISIICVTTISIIGISTQNSTKIKDSDISALLSIYFGKSEFKLFVESNTGWSGSCNIEGFSGSGSGDRVFIGMSLSCHFSFTMTAAGFLEVWALINDQPVHFGTTFTIGTTISGHLISPRLPSLLILLDFDNSINSKQNMYIFIGIIFSVFIISGILIITYKLKRGFKSHSLINTKYRSYQFKRRKSYKSEATYKVKPISKLSILSCPFCKAPLMKEDVEALLKNRVIKCEFCGHAITKLIV